MEVGTVKRKPEGGRSRKTLLSLTELDRDHLEHVWAAYLRDRGVKPSMGIVFSVALNILVERAKAGDLPGHPSLRKGMRRRIGE